MSTPTFRIAKSSDQPHKINYAKLKKRFDMQNHNAYFSCTKGVKSMGLMNTIEIRDAAVELGLETALKLHRATGKPLATCDKVLKAEDGKELLHEKSLREFSAILEPMLEAMRSAQPGAAMPQHEAGERKEAVGS